MSNHTPGPWTIGHWDDLLSNHVAIDAPSHGELAQVVWVIDDDASAGRRTPTCEANVRLIAAAPDLLEALKEARRAIGDHHAPNDCYATGPLTGDIRRDLVRCPACSAILKYDAAIEKAEGRA